MTSHHRQPRSLVILGAGYTGKVLYPLAKTQGWRTYATSRSPETHLGHIHPMDRLTFNLDDQNTWDNIPRDAHVIWCFPALPQAKAKQFLDQRYRHGGRLILLGSTSAYGKERHNPVDESTPLNIALPRVQSEEDIRKSCGAVLLRLAGLYGPDRHVLDWIRKGKVANRTQFVNLIHIEDVAEICLAALDKAVDGETYIVSDGHPRQWSEIFTEASKRWMLGPYPPSPAKHSGKRLTINKLQATLYASFLYPDLYQALDEIEQGRCQHKK
ncbi:MAG: hypothetical protein MRJ96_11850 [Nitrospirales bacterium]|nr:hypothetical protein [Nitrospira sp.]MDR4502134.1 hypothetical protein [Nitrospirales bacterium]